MKASIASMFVEADILVGRDMDEDTELWVTGFVRWEPTQQEFVVTGVRVTSTRTWVPDPERPGQGDYEPECRSGEFRNEREEQRAKEALISAAESEHVGECTGCMCEWGPKQKADGADWLCREHRERFQRRAA